jgi:putative Holliday junction resolvase
MTYTKIAALDIGDKWTGIALSDALGITARPYTTVETTHLFDLIITLQTKERVKKVVVGYPKTMKGTISDQTKKVEQKKEELAARFPTIEWILWDERLSSKRADSLHKGTSKEAKLKSHAIAAAFILETYLSYITPQTVDPLE